MCRRGCRRTADDICEGLQGNQKEALLMFHNQFFVGYFYLTFLTRSSPAGMCVVKYGWGASVPQREHLLLGVVVVVVPAFVAVARPALLLMLGLLLPLPPLRLPVKKKDS